MNERLLEVDNSYISAIFGRFDDNIKRIEKAFNVKIVNRGENI